MIVSEAFLLDEPDEFKGHFREPKAVQNAIWGEHLQYNEVRSLILLWDHRLAAGAEVKGAGALEYSFCDQRGALLETVDDVEGEMVTEERQGSKTRVTGYLRIGT